MKASSLISLLSLSVACLSHCGCSTARDRLGFDETQSRVEHLVQARQETGDVGESPAGDADDAQPDSVTTSLETVGFEDQPVVVPTLSADSGAIDDAEPPTDVEFGTEPAQQPRDRDGLTLESLEQLALQNNPAIQQAAAVASKASGIRNQVGLRPNPRIGYFGEEIGDGGNAGLHGAFVSQEFVRGGKLAWNQQVIGHDVEAVRWQVEAQRQRVLTDVRVQFYQALAAQRRLRLAREFQGVAEKGVEVSEERLRGKVGTFPDVLQSEIQLNEVDLTIQQAEFELEAAWKELAAVAGMPNLTPTDLVGELDAAIRERDSETVYSQIAAQSPVLASAYARVNRARSNLERQQVQPIPNLTGQVGVGHDDGTDDDFANVQLSLPLPIHNKNQGNIQAAYAEYCEATQNVERIRMQLRRELARVMREYQIAKATVERYENAILPKAARTLDLIQEGEQAGQFDFLRVLTARRAYFDVNLRYVTALGELSQANAKIEGLLLTGGLSNVVTYDIGDDLRGQALNGQ